MDRYSKNGIFSELEQKVIKKSKVCLIGCGGLGGNILEMLLRLGIGSITIVDGDVFDQSNLNRQLLSNVENMNKSKVAEGVKRAKLVNPEIEVLPIQDSLNEENARDLINNHDVVIDALDNISTRFILQKACEEEKIPLVHGAVAGWYGQVTTILPGNKSFNKIYPDRLKKDVKDRLGNPSFTPMLVASAQVSEVVKLLIARGEILSNKVLYIDTVDNEYFIIDL